MRNVLKRIFGFLSFFWGGFLVFEMMFDFLFNIRSELGKEILANLIQKR